jgi:hypothetical protein
MEEITVLEHKDSSAFWSYIDAFAHVPRVECRRTTLERLLAILSGFRVVEIQVESEVRAFLAIRRFVATVTVRCTVRYRLVMRSFACTYP